VILFQGAETHTRSVRYLRDQLVPDGQAGTGGLDRRLRVHHQNWMVLSSRARLGVDRNSTVRRATIDLPYRCTFPISAVFGLRYLFITVMRIWAALGAFGG